MSPRADIPADWTEFATHDGIVTLRLPSNWEAEEAEFDGTTAFGDPSDDDAGALTVSVDVFERDEDIGVRELPRILVRRGPMPIRISEDRYYIFEFDEAEDDGELVIEHKWTVIQQTAPREFAVVVAAYILGLNETRASAEPFVRCLEAAVLACEVDVPDESESGEFDDEDEDDEGESDLP